MAKEWCRCPVCKSTDIGLWNARKMTYHCHHCDSYWTKYGTIIDDSYRQSRNTSYDCENWNGFTDSDDYPTDGCGENGG